MGPRDAGRAGGARAAGGVFEPPAGGGSRVGQQAGRDLAGQAMHQRSPQGQGQRSTGQAGDEGGGAVGCARLAALSGAGPM